jgi:hypothetical protein
MNRFLLGAAPSVGYGLTVLGTLFLGNIALLLATLSHPELAGGGHFGLLLALAILGSLAIILTGLNLNKTHPLADRSAALWIWLLGLPVTRRLAEITLSVRWDQSMALEAGLLCAAVLIVLTSASRLAPERAP